jgi:hypothetical protein
LQEKVRTDELSAKLICLFKVQYSEEKFIRIQVVAKTDKTLEQIRNSDMFSDSEKVIATDMRKYITEMKEFYDRQSRALYDISSIPKERMNPNNSNQYRTGNPTVVSGRFKQMSEILRAASDTGIVTAKKYKQPKWKIFLKKLFHIPIRSVRLPLTTEQYDKLPYKEKLKRKLEYIIDKF